MEKNSSKYYCFLVTLILVIGVIPFTLGDHDYAQALNKGILFYEAQRSGYLPSNQRVQWRSNSGLNDGRENGVNLVGGYYDAGDNVKFGLPMAFTITMLSWSIIEYGRQMANTGELSHAMDAVKWGTDYFIKAHPEPNVLYGEVGDGNTDHYCWQRPEDMTTSRTAYRIDTTRPGSDLAGETAAAMAAASIVFRHSDPEYSTQLLNHAGQLFEFADKYRGKYDGSITVAQKYYRSVSGYADELLWAAVWMYKATNKDYYMNYLGENGNSLGGTDWAMTEFSWDVKYPGVQTLVAKMLLQGKGGQYKTVFEQYQQKAEYFMCACLGKSSQNVQRTPGGLLYLQSWNNMQFVTTSSFLLTVYSDYLSSTGKSLNCPSANVAPTELLSFAKSQVDYILGDNPRATSYMVGYGNTYPQQVHHRASSIVSYKVDSSFVTCRGGYATWFGRRASDPNVLTGALVGGPGPYDNFADERDNYEQTEPATYNNAPLVGVLARLHGGQNAYNQILAEDVPLVNPNPNPNPTAQPKLVQKPIVTLPVAGSGSSPIGVEQKMTTSWVANGKTYYRYSAILINKSDKTLNKLNLSIQNLYGPIWGVTKIGESYSFPPWMNSLAAGKSMEFVYIQSAPPAGLSIASYTLN